MTNIVNGLKDLFVSRLKNFFLINFTMAWVIYNYNITLEFLFEEMTIKERIQFINYHIQYFDIFDMFIIPSFLALIYIFIFPILNLILNYLYDMFIIVQEEKIKNAKIIRNLNNEKAKQRLKLESGHFLKRIIENEIRRDEEEILAKEEQRLEELNTKRTTLSKMEELEYNKVLLTNRIKTVERENEDYKNENDKFQDEKNLLYKELENIENLKKAFNKKYAELEYTNFNLKNELENIKFDMKHHPLSNQKNNDEENKKLDIPISNELTKIQDFKYTPKNESEVLFKEKIRLRTKLINAMKNLIIQKTKQ